MPQSEVSPAVQTIAQISHATLERLPRYLAYLKIRQKQGVQQISATIIAEDLRLTPVSVRKDLAAVCQAGRPKVGFPLDILIDDLERFLGCGNVRDAFLIGAGKLGRALLAHRQFGEYGLDILAAFDVSPRLVGQEVEGKPVFPLRKLPNLAQRMGVHVGILTVPAEAAQTACDILLEGGIRAIWNFTPTPLDVPATVVVRNENLAASFAVLSRDLAAVFAQEQVEVGGTTL